MIFLMTKYNFNVNNKIYKFKKLIRMATKIKSFHNHSSFKIN